jgi:hypothetical protein
MALLTDADIKAAVAAALKKASADDLPAYWDEIVEAAHVSGWQDVLEALLRRGFTAAQVEAWDRAAEFERKQSLYHALLNGGGLESFDLTGVRLYDQSKKLEVIQVYIGGVYTTPANGTAGPGTVGYGEPSGGSTDAQFPPSGFDW